MLKTRELTGRGGGCAPRLRINELASTPDTFNNNQIFPTLLECCDLIGKKIPQKCCIIISAGDIHAQ